MRRRAIGYALLSATLFGASTPLAKLLLGEISPLLLAGLLYLGSGIGLFAWLAVRNFVDGNRGRSVRLTASDLPWLAGAIAAGGIAAPALLMLGLARTGGAAASLLLNLEAVFTALVAWTVFRENFDKRIFLGMLFIVCGGAVLSWQAAPEWNHLAGPLLIIAACLAWAVDNNLTRRISGGDPVLIAGLKGAVAGGANLSMALAYGAVLPPLPATAAAAAVGLAGYGVSLVLFILALRDLGTARTGAYFSVAPFFGAALALSLLGEQAGAAFWSAAVLMAAGVWLHLSERHEHQHVHEPILHTHEHRHDAHHRHDHEFPWDGAEPHVHAHQHLRLVHLHPHYPDLHHRHDH